MANTDKILSLYKRDERAAMQELFDVYYEPLLLYCNRLIRDSGSAEDIVQEWERLYHKASVEENVSSLLFAEEQAGREVELLYRTINRLPDECRGKPKTSNHI